MNSKKLVLLVFVILSVIFLLTGCSFAGPKLKRKAGLGPLGVCSAYPIKSLNLTYSDPQNSKRNHQISIDQDDECTYLNYSAEAYSCYGTITMKLSQKAMDEIKALYQKHKVYQWNGFERYGAESGIEATIAEPEPSCELMIRFTDDSFCWVRGCVEYPTGWEEFIKDLRTILDSYIEEGLIEAKNNFLEKDGRGELKWVRVIIDHTNKDDGYDKNDNDYTFTFAKTENGTTFFTMVHENSKKYFGGNWFCDYREEKLPVESVDYDKIDELVTQHNLLDWKEFGDTKNIYPCTESFSIELAYENGVLHLENSEFSDTYLVFEEEFLTLASNMLKNAISEYEIKQYDWTESNRQ